MANKIYDIQKDTASLTNVGKVRKENQDNIGFAETQNGDIFIVCDGMGGHKGGKTASNIAVDSIVEYFSAESYPDIPDAID
ncbi:MAG: protein phosphatase 2C domain-containing protein, partial [Bacteroidota bacterium]|nr:protein phosphatase 2C domain-containing protein [Bacteroidota bacterium]